MEFRSFEEKLAGLEALLFIHGEPLQIQKIDSIFSLSEGEGEALLKNLEEKLAAEDRGLVLVRDGGKVQIATKSQWAELLEAFVKEELKEDLTPASLETLAIVAFLGPISRSKIEYLRGVNSMFTLRNLRIRGLIERSPDPALANSYLYSPTTDLLKHLGASRKEDLPEYEKFHSLLQKFETSPPPTE